MPSSPASASAPSALTLDTPSTLATITTAGTYVLWLDCSNLAAGDKLAVRIYVKLFSGGSSLLARAALLEGTTIALSGSEKAFFTVPIMIENEIKFELEQTDGTGRVVPWKVMAA